MSAQQVEGSVFYRIRRFFYIVYKVKGIHFKPLKNGNMGCMVQPFRQDVVISNYQRNFDSRIFLPPGFKLLPLFINPAMKKITQKDKMLRLNLINKLVQHFKVTGIYLLGYRNAVAPKMSRFTDMQISYQ